MGRSPCCATDSGLQRGAWTAQEDLILGNYISIHGEGQWRALPKNAGLKRCGKSCRLRWLNYLRPDIKRGNISPDEDELIIRMHKLLGNRWSLIAGRLQGRTDNEIKNYWNTHLSKTRVAEKEILPQPHTRHKKLKRAGLLKSSPVKVTAVRIAKSRRIYVDEGNSDHQELRSSEAAESVSGSKSCCDIVDTTTTQNISVSMENNDDQSPCSMLDSDDGPFLHYHYSANNEVGTYHVLKDNLSWWECDMLLSPCDYFRFIEFVARPSDELEQMCSLKTTADDGRIMAEIYNDTQQQQLVDWVNELECLQKSNMQSLTMLLLESEENTEKSSSNFFSVF